MQTIIFSFLAGMLADFAVLYFADARTTLAAFLIGCLLTFGLIVAVVISSPRRIRRTAELLNALAGWLYKAEEKHAPVKAAPATKQPKPAQDPIAKDLVSGLRGLGADKDRATAAAARVMKEHPGASFDQLFREAVTVCSR